MTTDALPNAGELDPQFGVDGIEQIEGPSDDFFRAHGLSLSDDGKLLIACSGVHSSGTYTYFLLGRRTQLGKPDVFGEKGFVSGRFTSDASLSSEGLKTLLVKNSRYLLLGKFTDGTRSFLPAFARFDATGKIDTRFGRKGRYVASSTLPAEYGSASDPNIDACIQSTQHILSIHPHVSGPNILTTLILRSEPSGKRDDTFNENKAHIDARQWGSERTRLTSIVVQADDKIVVCGYAEDIRGIKTGIILRYHKDGREDFVFRQQDWRFEDLVIMGDRILCCGSTASREALLIELDAAGKLVGKPSLTPENISTRWTKVRWQDRTIGVIGERNEALGPHLVVARFNDDRTMDPSFGKQGCVSIDFGGQSSAPRDFIYDANQGIVILASVKFIGNEGFFLARLFS